MLINTPEGAVLEIFWRERGAKPWSQVTAHRFLSRFRQDRQGFGGIRWLLADRTDAGRTWRAPEEAILHRAAWLIATDSVIVAEFGSTERWPGSGFVLGSGRDSILLFWRDKLHLIRDTAQVEHWISDMQKIIRRVDKQKKNKQNPSQADTEALGAVKAHVAELRDMIGSAPGVPQPINLNEDSFLGMVSNYFKSGDLLPIYHRYPGIAEPGPKVDPPDGPTPPKPSGGKDDPDDPSDDPFIPGVCLLRASKEGSPFVTMPEPGEPT